MRVEFVIDHILMKLLVCLDGELYAENGYGKTDRVEHVEHHSNYNAYRLNEKDLLQTLRLQTSVLSLNQYSFLTFHTLLHMGH